MFRVSSVVVFTPGPKKFVIFVPHMHSPALCQQRSEFEGAGVKVGTNSLLINITSVLIIAETYI